MKQLFRLLLVTAAVASVTSMSACRAEQRGLGREELLSGLEKMVDQTPLTATREELVAARIPDPSASPEIPVLDTALDRARSALAHGNIELASRLLAPLTSAAAAVHRCISARVREDADGIVEACAAALTITSEATTKSALLAALWSVREERPRAFDVVSESTAQWRQLCDPGAGCAVFSAQLSTWALESASRAKKDAAAKAAIAQSGRLRRARILGPYRGDPVTTFWQANSEKPLAPRPERFVDVTRATYDGVHFPSRRNEPGFYRLQFEVDAGGRGHLVVAGSRGLRVLIDSQPVLEKSRASDAPMVTVDLVPGRHRIELQVAAAGFSRAVTVSLLDDNGRPWGREVEPGTSRSRYAGLRTTPVHTKDESPAPIPHLAHLDSLLLDAERIDNGMFVRESSALSVARLLLRDYGRAPAARLAAARLLEIAPGSSSPRVASTVRRLRDDVREQWPTHAGLLRNWIEEVRSDQPGLALERAREGHRLRPDQAAIARELASLALSAAAFDEALTAARRALEIARTRETLDLALTVLEEGNFIEEAALLRAERAGLEVDLYSGEMARLWLDQGDTPRALEELNRICAAVPGHEAEDLRLSLLELNAPAIALTEVDALLEAFPNDRRLALRRVELIAAVGGESANPIRDARRLALRFGGDRAVYDTLLELGAPDPAAADLARGDALAAAFFGNLPSPFAEQAGGYVLDSTRVTFAADGGRITTRHVLFELRTKDAIDEWGEVSLDEGARFARLIVRKPDGRLVEPERHDDLGTASLTGLEVGDVVEILRISFEPGSVGDDFDQGRQVFLTTSPASVRELEIRVPIAQETEFELISRNGGPEARIGEVTGPVSGVRLRTFTFGVVDAKALQPEPFPGPVDADVPIVIYARRVSLAALAAARYRHHAQGLPGEAAVPDPWLSEVVRLVAPSTTASERFAQLFSFVVREIESGSSGDTSTTLLEGVGDRVALLFDLACRAGIRADLVSLHLPVTGDVTLPTMSRFPLDGVRAVDETGNVHLAIVGDGAAVFDALPVTKGVQVLTLTPTPAASVAATNLDTSLPNAPALDVKLTLRARMPREKSGETKAGLAGLLTVQVPPHRSADLRRALSAADDSRRQAAFEAALASSFPGVVVEQVRLPNLNRDGTGLAIGVDLFIPVDTGVVVNFSSVFSQGAGATLGLASGLAAHLSVAERKRSLMLLPSSETLDVSFDLGRGGTFTHVPPSFSIEAGPVLVQQNVAVTDGRLRLTRKIVVEDARIGVSRFQELRSEWVALSSRLTPRISFLLPRRNRPSQADVDRKRRALEAQARRVHRPERADRVRCGHKNEETQCDSES